MNTRKKTLLNSSVVVDLLGLSQEELQSQLCRTKLNPVPSIGAIHLGGSANERSGIIKKLGNTPGVGWVWCQFSENSRSFWRILNGQNFGNEMDLLLRHALTCIFTSHNAYTTHNTWFPYISMKSGTFGTEHLCIEALSRWNAIVSRREYWKWRSGASAFELWCRASDQHMIQCDSHWDEISQVMQRVCCRSVYCIVLIMDSAKQFLDILMEFKGYCSVKEVRLHIGLDSILSPVHVWYNMIYLIQHVLVVPAAPMRYPTTVAKPVSFWLKRMDTTMSCHISRPLQYEGRSSDVMDRWQIHL